MISLLNNKSNPEKQKLDQLTYRQRFIIDTVEYFRQKGLCSISQISLGKKLGVSRETINRDISALKDMGLLAVQHRFNNSNYTSTTSWFRKPEVQKLLPYYFSNFRVIILPLALLSSSAHTSMEVLRFIYPSYPPISYEGVSMGEVITDKEKYSEEKKEEEPKKDNEASMKPEKAIGEEMVPEASHIKKICQALQRRGSTVINDDALKLLAYPPDVHERASKRFKTDSQGKIKNPLAYYLFICKEIISQDGRKADWSKVEKLRSEGYVLLEEALQGATRSIIPTHSPDSQKREGVNSSYSEYVKQEQKRMTDEALARKTKTGPLAEEVLSWHQVVMDLQKRAAAGNIGAQFTLPIAEDKLKHLISQYQPDLGKEQPAPVILPSQPTGFKTPLSILSSLSKTSELNLLIKSESTTLKEECKKDVWQDWKEYDPELLEEEF